MPDRTFASSARTFSSPYAKVIKVASQAASVWNEEIAFGLFGTNIMFTLCSAYTPSRLSALSSPLARLVCLVRRPSRPSRTFIKPRLASGTALSTVTSARLGT